MTVDGRIAKALRGKAATRTLGRFVSSAIAHELERERLRAELDRLDDEFGLGPPDDELDEGGRPSRCLPLARP